MTHRPRGLSSLILSLCAIFWISGWPLAGWAQEQASGVAHASPNALPNAPEVALAGADPPAPISGPSAPSEPPARPESRVIEPWQKAPPLTDDEKMELSLREAANPINLLTSLYSAGYEQLTGSNPKYGSDSGAFADRFGAAMLRTASARIFSDGVFASAFHQDPRYYRIGTGSIWTRGVRSAEQALIRRSDDGEQEINTSSFAARAAAATLTLAYYPPASRKASVVLSTFAVSIATNAGEKEVLEFMPDLANKYPILKKFEVQ